MEKPESIADRASMEALHCYAFVSQLDAPVLHKAFTKCGDLLLECATEIDSLNERIANRDKKNPAEFWVPDIGPDDRILLSTDRMLTDEQIQFIQGSIKKWLDGDGEYPALLLVNFRIEGVVRGKRLSVSVETKETK